jgi:hypothetical protein
MCKHRFDSAVGNGEFLCGLPPADLAAVDAFDDRDLICPGLSGQLRNG